jgi:hypothetical protein
MVVKKMTPEVFEQICQMIETTELGLSKICAEFDVSKSYFLKVVNESAENGDRYARAKEQQMDFMAEKIIEIADDSSGDAKITEGGNVVQNSEFINRSRLRVDARKWLMSKLAPKKYGDKLDLTTGGEAMTNQTLFVLPDGTKLPI